MTVVRIVMDLATADVGGMTAFYSDLLNLSVVMDQGWITTLGNGELGPIQLSIASQGGNGAPVPDMTVQVEDVDEVHVRARAMGCEILHGPVDEPWGVRRFFVADPMGRVLNIMAHI